MYTYKRRPTNILPYLEIGYVEEAPPISEDDYINHIVDNVTDFWGIDYQGQPIGFILCFRNEMHTAIRKDHHNRWFNKKALRTLQEVKNKYGSVYTKVFLKNYTAMNFCFRLGFSPVSVTDGIVTMIMKVEK